MDKQQAIERLQNIYEAMKASDFGDAFADTPEEELELAARITVKLSIDLLKASEATP